VAGDDELTKHLLETMELLEAIAADRSLLDGLSGEERIRFATAAGLA